MPKRYKYYCRECGKVTDWALSGPRQGVEMHTCYICKTTVKFIVEPEIAQTVNRFCGVCGKVTKHIAEKDQGAYEVCTCKRCGVSLRDKVR